jgi:hypothetical protein
LALLGVDGLRGRVAVLIFQDELEEARDGHGLIGGVLEGEVGGNKEVVGAL